MSVDLTSPTPRSHLRARLRAQPVGRRTRRRAQRSERKRLARQDRLAAQLAELHGIRALLRDAVAVVATGWVQHGWFSVVDAHGRPVSVTAYAIDLVATGRPVAGACLVGAIVHAGGGPSAAETQLVQRTLDLTWHALRNDERQPVRWCPAPAVRTAHIRDLTRWNDDVDRTAGQVTALLHAAVRTADAQSELLRAP